MVTEMEIIIKLSFAALLGALIGLERDLSKKPLGMRTASMVCISAALFPLLVEGVNGEDVSRVIQGIITGIGFLGAGVIIKSTDGSRVQGMTTAAALWVLVGIGYGIGVGMYFAAAFATALVLFLLLIKRRYRLLE